MHSHSNCSGHATVQGGTRFLLVQAIVTAAGAGLEAVRIRCCDLGAVMFAIAVALWTKWNSVSSYTCFLKPGCHQGVQPLGVASAHAEGALMHCVGAEVLVKSSVHESTQTIPLSLILNRTLNWSLCLLTGAPLQQQRRVR